MAAADLADLIISEMKSAIGQEGDYDNSAPSKANIAIAKAITDYLIKNTLISIAYAGIIPGAPPIPDPVVADVFRITGNCSPASSTNFDAWLMELSLNIQNGFQFSIGNLGLMPVAPTLCFVGPPITGNQVMLGLSSIHKSNNDNPQKPIWTAISGAILTWLNTQLPPISFACMNSSAGSTGMATTVKIMVM